jgi:hypothetical protein
MARMVARSPEPPVGWREPAIPDIEPEGGGDPLALMGTREPGLSPTGRFTIIGLPDPQPGPLEVVEVG